MEVDSDDSIKIQKLLDIIKTIKNEENVIEDQKKNFKKAKKPKRKTHRQKRLL